MENVNVDFNDHRVQRHLAALVRGYGSTTEGIVIDFVRDSYDCIGRQNCSVQGAWMRLDEDQKRYVMAFRDMLLMPVLGDQNDFPHLFYINIIRQQYRHFLENYEMENGENAVTENIIKQLEEQAEIFVKKSLYSDESTPIWSVERDFLPLV